MTAPEVRNYNNEDLEGKNPQEIKNEEALDKSKNKVDEKKLADFKSKAEFLQQHWSDEYKQIVDDIMSQFDRDIKKILDKSDSDKNVKEVKIENITTKTDAQLEQEAGEVMSQQPKKFESRESMINKINRKWSIEDVNQLNKIIDKYMEEVDDKYQAYQREKNNN